VLTRGYVVIAFVLLILLTPGFFSPRNSSATTGSSSPIKHVILIMMENHNYETIIGNKNAPYINKLANTYALATNYYGIQYPSLPNYVGVTSGSNGGITTDCDSGPSSGGCQTSNTNIFSLLQSKGLTWKAYEESMPASCDRSNSGAYMVHHNPIPYYTDLAAVCSQNDLPFGNIGTKSGAFFAALDGNSLPSLSFITPNSCNDMHSCPVSSGDNWLSMLIPDILNSPSYSTTITIITWDTGDCTSPCNEYANGGGQVATLIIGPSNLVHYGKFNTFYNHYSILATIERIFNLGNLGRNDKSAIPMSAIIPSS
jgi:phospholipase C